MIELGFRMIIIGGFFFFNAFGMVMIHLMMLLLLLSLLFVAGGMNRSVGITMQWAVLTSGKTESSPSSTTDHPRLRLIEMIGRGSTLSRVPAKGKVTRKYNST